MIPDTAHGRALLQCFTIHPEQHNGSPGSLCSICVPALAEACLRKLIDRALASPGLQGLAAWKRATIRAALIDEARRIINE